MLLCIKFQKIRDLNLEYFIAQRIAEHSQDNKPSVMVRIAVISVALSITVMVLSLAVIMGFKKEITQRIIGVTSHLEVVDISAIRGVTENPINYTPHLDSIIRSIDGFQSLSPYAIKGGIIKTADAVIGVGLKGLTREDNFNFFRQYLLQGDIPRVGDSIRNKDILISKYTADKLMLGVGDKVEMLFVESDRTPRRDRFKVSGIYSTGMNEMDKALILTDIRNVQRLYGWSDRECSGVEITTTNFDQSAQYGQTLDNALFTDESGNSINMIVRSATDIYPHIFDWLKAHDVNAVVIITIMLLVAFFNVASALLILVIERIKMIGILKAMGMNNRSLRKLFLFRALFITIKGILWGNGAGLLLCLIQKYFHLIKLNSDGYLLSEVPIDISLGWWVTLNLGVIVAILILLIIPASIVSRIRPEESIRYN